METNETNDRFLKLTALNLPPYITVYEDPSGVISVKGPFGKLQQELFKRLNFRYVIKLPKDGGYGTMLPNGTATGMLGMLYNKDADVIVNPYGITYGRFHAADFLPIIVEAPMSILSSTSEFKTTVDFTNTVMRVSWMVWMGYFASIWISCLCYLIEDLFMKYKKKQRDKASKNYAELGVYISEFIRIFINQGSTHFATSSLKRILLLSFAISTIFFNMYFGGDMHTEAVVDTKNNIDSLKKLIEKSTICPLTAAGAFLHVFLRTSKGGIYDGFRERIRSCPLSSIPLREFNSEVTFRRIVSGKFAVLEARIVLLVMSENICNMHPNVKLHVSREPVTSLLASIAIGKHVDLNIKEAITKVIERFINSGIMLKWIEEETGLLASCLRPSPINIEPELTMGDLESLRNVFYVWIAGLALSVTIFVAELLVYSLGRKRSKVLVSMT